MQKYTLKSREYKGENEKPLINKGFKTILDFGIWILD
jgi:hypothetical protein